MCNKSQGFYGLNSTLSLAAQAVLNASSADRLAIAAALRAVVDQSRRGPEHWEGSHPDDFDNGWAEAMGWVAIIAEELEGGND